MSISVEELPQCIKSILDGRYEDVLSNELFRSLIESCDGNDFSKSICSGIEKEVIPRNSWLCMGIASLLYFIQCNWTGPRIVKDVNWLKIRREDALKDLSLHDECDTNVEKPELLYLAKIIFSNEILQSVCKSCVWWSFRANLLHQSVLNESSGAIFDESEQLIDKINDLSLLRDAHCKALFYIEAAQFYLYYRRVQNSEMYVESAQEAARLSLSLEGALGRRTKHQQQDKAQLLLKIDLGKSQFPSRRTENLPKSLELNDDVRLERIEFSEGVRGAQLGAVEEAIILVKQ